MNSADLTLYEKVEKYFEEDGKACWDCPYLHKWREGRGEFWGTPCSEEMEECTLLESGQVELCPALIEVEDEKR